MIFDETYGVRACIGDLYNVNCTVFSKTGLVFGNEITKSKKIQDAVSGIAIMNNDTIKDSIEKSSSTIFNCLPSHNNSGTKKYYTLNIEFNVYGYVINIYDESGFNAVKIYLQDKLFPSYSFLFYSASQIIFDKTNSPCYI